MKNFQVSYMCILVPEMERFKLNVSLKMLSNVNLQAVMIYNWKYYSKGGKCTGKNHEISYYFRKREELQQN
jgi:hypothetical protein